MKIGRIALALAAGVLLALVLVVAGLAPPRLEVPAREDAVLTGLTVIQPGVERRENQSIVLRHGRIAEVRPTRPSDPAPACAGCFALPGLVDAHVHTPPRVAVGNQELFSLLYLAHGVTTVRDLGASESSVARLASRLREGELVGPRMLRCGPVLDGDPPGWPMATVVRTPAQGETLVARLAAQGVDCIKVYNDLEPEVFASIASAARRHGLPLVGHVPHAVGLARVEDFEAQHMTGVPYLSRPRPPRGWDLRDEDVLALSEAEIDAALRLARQRRVSFTPTLANFTLRLTASDPERFPPTASSHHLPGFWFGAWDVIAGHPSDHASIQRRIEAAPSMRALVRRAREHGVDVLAGTDTLMPWVVPGESLHLELAALHAALGDAEAALAAATTVNGRHLAPGELGVIRAGARADLLLLPKDPTLDLAALRDWRTLFVDGRRYERPTLDGWLARYDQHFHGALYRSIVGSVVSFVVERFEHTPKQESEGLASTPASTGPTG